MKRKVYKELINWKSKAGRKPLVVFGARQVGKTYVIREFAEVEYAKTAYLDFSKNAQAASIFEQSLEPKAIIRQLETLLHVNITAGDTLIVLDEIQLCEQALTSLKYFYEDAPDYHVAAAGSLLGVKVNREKYSFPVGKVDIIVMHPLDFEEYLWARGEKSLCPLIREALANNGPFALHEHAMDIVRDYYLVGGMPEAVQASLSDADYHAEDGFSETRRIIALIEQGYLADMTKYSTTSETPRIFEAWRSIPSQLAKGNRKFQYSKVRSGGRASQYYTAIEWLGAAGLVNRCTQVSEGIPPLKAFENPDFFKLYYADTGLLSAAFDAHPSDLTPKNDKASRFRGALTESYCMQQFASAGVALHYWGVQSKSEVELVARLKNGDVIPVEMKSGSNVRANSLRAYREAYKPTYLARISAKNFGFEGGVRSIPLYAAHFFAQEFEKTPMEQVVFGV